MNDFDPEHPHDLNERAYRERPVSIVPLEIQVSVMRDGKREQIPFHTATDADLAYLAEDTGQDAVVGFRWARSFARRLAGIKPAHTATAGPNPVPRMWA